MTEGASEPTCFAWETFWPHAVPDLQRIVKTTDRLAVTCLACLHALGSQKHEPPPYPQPGTVGWDEHPPSYVEPASGASETAGEVERLTRTMRLQETALDEEIARRERAEQQVAALKAAIEAWLPRLDGVDPEVADDLRAALD
jgi:hypothetical protein